MPVVQAQHTVTGTVLDAATGEALPGATVILAGTTQGTTTDLEGGFRLTNLASGTHTLAASFVGFEEQTAVLTLRGRDAVAVFRLVPSSVTLESLEVFASRASERETPVAFTDVDQATIRQELASRDVPLVLNRTPSVYSTAQGGGSGDARINVRGFNQRNVAVMINGVPINDMENGWVYWSNWDGLGEATTSIQLQRGLSVVNLATPSVGGTLNIITNPAESQRQLVAKQEFGSYGFLKSTVTLSTGQMQDRYAFTLSGIRKTGNGFYTGTWIDAWAYYAAAAVNVNARHHVSAHVVGAPQRHGQNLYRQNIAAYDHEFARQVLANDGLDGATIDDILSTFAEGGRKWNQNASPVAADYPSEQHNGYNLVYRRRDAQISERENFYHAPLVSLNYFGQLTPRALLSSVAYYHGGRGGGTGVHGSMQWDYSGPSRVVDYNATINLNRDLGVAEGILRNSHNNKWILGNITKLTWDPLESLRLEAGLDWRTSQIHHYRTVRDLLGGTSYRWSEDYAAVGLGDRFDYDNSTTVDWIGGYLQGEFSTSTASVYGMAGYSNVRYSFVDHFRLSDGKYTAVSDWLGGYQVKGGASYQMGQQLSAFANLGYISKVPVLDGVLDEARGVAIGDPRNETFMGLEAGIALNSTARRFAGKVNIYHTIWNDRTITQSVNQASGDDGLIHIGGLDARHRGIEGEITWRPIALVRVDVAASLGSWTYTDDVSARYTPDRSDPSSQASLDLYLNGIRVGDAPQAQLMYGATVYPVRGLYAMLLLRTYGRYYAHFDPTSRTEPSQAGHQVWRVPGYTIADLHIGFDVPERWSRLDAEVLASLLNVADRVYIQDASNNSRFNAYRGNGTGANRADDAEVFLGLPRSFNLGMRVTFH